MASGTDSLYLKSNYGKYAGKFAAYAPEVFKAFGEFNKLALKDGALSGRFKELIAIAVAHTTGCPYCIDIHVVTGRKLNLAIDEIFEAIAVAALVKGYSAFHHGAHTLRALSEQPSDELYSREGLESLSEFEAVNEELYTSLAEFRRQVLAGGRISSREKAIIAVAVAHTVGDAYGIEQYTTLARQEQVSIEQLTETILVATALKAGSALAHRVNAYVAYSGAEA